MTAPEILGQGGVQVWQPCYRAFFVYYVAIFLAVFGPLINPAAGLPPWLGLLIGILLGGLVCLLRFGQEYRATPQGLQRLSRWPALKEEIPWSEVGDIKIQRGLVQSLLQVGNVIISDKRGTPRLAWERVANPKAVKEALEARRP
uniref:PH domain-containing protein n=1 Tax=Desulfobacca acetoxidans TaxID=60893 RepID=A0A7V4LDC0_9BACT